MNKPSPPRLRRRFLSGTGALCAGAMVGNLSAAGPADSFARAAAENNKWGAARFRACLGSRFDVVALGRGQPAASLTLAHVSPQSVGSASQDTDDLAFTIDLAGASTPLQQDTYAVTHPELGEFVALLVPSADGRTLTGVFHRYR